MVKSSACTWTFFILLGWCAVTSSADNGQRTTTTNKCVWHVFYSLEPILHEQGLQLYFKTSRDSCQTKMVNLELFQARWSNVTKCIDLDDLRIITFNKTQVQHFWYTKLRPGNYCILIQPSARACHECLASFTELVTLLPSPNKEVNQTLTKKASALEEPNATSLYIAVSGVLLIAAATSLLLILKRRSRMPAPDGGFSDNGSRECMCGSREALLGTEVFLLHARDAWHRTEVLGQKLKKQLPASPTLVSTLSEELFTSRLEWCGQRIAHAKVVVVESEEAVRLRRNQLKKAGIPGSSGRGEPEKMHSLGTETGSSVEDEIGHMNSTFLHGLTSIMSDTFRCFAGYDRVFVVRFPSTPSDLSIADLVVNVRFTLPEDFPDLCRRLLEMNCRKCLVEKYHVWKTIADDQEFRMLISREWPAHHIPV